MSPEPVRVRRYAVIIPAYREEGRIGPVVRQVRALGHEVIVIDDGSPDAGGAEAETAGATVIRHPENRGKGAAMTTGFAYAREKGYEAVVTMDADGQHDPAEIGKFIEAYERTGIPVLVGNRLWNPKGMPLVRRLTNRFMSWLLSRAMRQYVPDTQCGYRLYRSDVTAHAATESQRFDAESEILLRVAAHGWRIGPVRIATIYRDEKSKIRPVQDTLRFMGMLWRFRRNHRRT